MCSVHWVTVLGGHHVNNTGISPLQEKVTVIQDYPQPTSLNKLRGFLGLVNFYRRFITDCAEIIYPLIDLLATKGTTSRQPIVWTPECVTRLSSPSRQPYSTPRCSSRGQRPAQYRGGCNRPRGRGCIATTYCTGVATDSLLLKEACASRDTIQYVWTRTIGDIPHYSASQIIICSRDDCSASTQTTSH